MGDHISVETLVVRLSDFALFSLCRPWGPLFNCSCNIVMLPTVMSLLSYVLRTVSLFSHLCCAPLFYIEQGALRRMPILSTLIVTFVTSAWDSGLLPKPTFLPKNISLFSNFVCPQSICLMLFGPSLDVPVPHLLYWSDLLWLGVKWLVFPLDRWMV